jgi:predicted transporter
VDAPKLDRVAAVRYRRQNSRRLGMHVLIGIALFIAIAIASSTKEGVEEVRKSPTFKAVERASWWGLAFIAGLVVIAEFSPR